VPDAARRLVVVLLALTTVVGGTACSKKKATARARATPTTAASHPISWNVAPSPDTPAAVRDATVALLQRYLDDAILAPLRSGGPAPDLGALFTGEAAPHISGGDRAAMVGEGMPKPQGGVKADAANATITPFKVRDQLPLVVAEIDLRLLARDVEGSGVNIVQHGELTLVPEGSTWRIGGYDMLVTRDTPAGTTTSTAVKS
jgi:hypothetical protein